MRSQTPIHKQRTTQTKLSRSRPHNPSLVRRKQSSGQRTSPLRQMQQQTRQRTRRKRKSTPLPKKRRRKRQTTHSRHANTTHRHMVNHTPQFHNNRKGGARRKAGNREEGTQQENAMVFGDNVRARRAARALPRTPATRRRKRETERRGRQTTRPHAPSFYNPHHNTRTTLKHTPQHIKS